MIFLDGFPVPPPPLIARRVCAMTVGGQHTYLRISLFHSSDFSDTSLSSS